MFEVHNDKEFEKVEGLLRVVADSQGFFAPKDKLTKIIQENDEYLTEELNEEDLMAVVAAVKPAIPKYKLMEKEM